MSLAERYTILEKLGEGGMAEVYRAQHLLLEREVAIKFIHPAMGDDPEFDQRFKREAQAIARLNHPNIIHVYDFDRDATRGYFMVMELLQGKDLAQYLRRFRKNEEFIPLPEVLRITRDIADALDYAHEHGVVHRDIKPSNIFLTENKRVVVTDFGIAKLTNKSAITSADTFIGTPHYFAPEFSSGMPTDHRVDIYATGAMFYQLLTGHFPYNSESPIAVISQHINAPIPNPQTIREDLPPLATAIVKRALAKNPDDRYLMFSDMIVDLEVLAADAGIEIELDNSHTPRPTTRPATRPIPLETPPTPRPSTAPQSASFYVPLTPAPVTEIHVVQSNTKLWLGLGAVAVLLLGVVGFLVFGGEGDTRQNTAAQPSATPPLGIEPAAEGEYLYIVANVSNDQHPEVDTPRQLLNALQAGELQTLLGTSFRAEYVDRTIRTQQEATQLGIETGALIVVWGLEDAAGLEIVMLAPHYPPNTLRELHFKVPVGEDYVDIIGRDLSFILPYVAEQMTDQQMLRDNRMLASVDINTITQPQWGDISQLRVQPMTPLERELLNMLAGISATDYAATDQAITAMLQITPDEPSLYFLRFTINSFLRGQTDLARADIAPMQRLLPDNPITPWCNAMIYLFEDDYEGLYSATLDISDPTSSTGQILGFYHALAALVLGKFSEVEVTVHQIAGEGMGSPFDFPLDENLLAIIYDAQGDIEAATPFQIAVRTDRNMTKIAANISSASLPNPPMALIFWFAYALEISGEQKIAEPTYMLLVGKGTATYLPFWRLGVIAEQASKFDRAANYYQSSVDATTVPFPIAQYQLALLLHQHPELEPESTRVCTLLVDATISANTNPEFYSVLLAEISSLQTEAGCLGE